MSHCLAVAGLMTLENPLCETKMSSVEATFSE